jgi:AcrR family transcriptional regulator
MRKAMPTGRSGPEAPAPRRPPRRLDASRDTAIFRAALDGLTDVGYDRLTMDQIASRAHASKATLYRRWPSKAGLIIDAIVAQREAVQLPDTGSLKADIDAIIAALPEQEAHAGQHYAMLLGLVNAASHDQALRDALSKHVLGQPRRLIRQLLERAMSRGEVPADRDLDLIANTLIGLNMLRLAEGKPIDREHVTHVLWDVVYPLATTRQIDDVQRAPNG